MTSNQNEAKFGLFFSEITKKWVVLALNDAADKIFTRELDKQGAELQYKEIVRRYWYLEMANNFPNAIAALECNSVDAVLAFVPNSCTFQEVHEPTDL
jgi:hypothetical protein